jgi:hypothetical protein
LTIGDVLLALVQVLVGGAAGYALGERQDRAQTLYQERAKNVLEIRNKLLAIRHLLRDERDEVLFGLLGLDAKGLVDMTTDNLESYFQFQLECRAAYEAMQGYEAAQRPWLEPSTQRIYQDIAEELHERLHQFEITLIRTLRRGEMGHEERKQAADDLRKWIAGEGEPGLDGLLEKWDREVARVLGLRPRRSWLAWS